VVLTLHKGKASKVVHIYSDDICMLKALQARIAIVGGNGELRTQYKALMSALSQIYRVSQAAQFVQTALLVDKQRSERLIKAQILAAQIRDVAERQWQVNRKILLKLKSKVTGPY
jgi:hypothetical protein